MFTGKEQDEFAVASHIKAAKALADGKFKDVRLMNSYLACSRHQILIELHRCWGTHSFCSSMACIFQEIVPVHTPKGKVVTKDNLIRPKMEASKVATLKPVFRKVIHPISVYVFVFFFLHSLCCESLVGVDIRMVAP